MLAKHHFDKVAHNAPTNSDLQLQRVLDDPSLYVAVGARFWKFADIPADRSKCWNWTGARRSRQYGNFKLVSYVTVAAHRLAYILAKGEHPREMMVCHTCDNRACVNPDHLFLGTHEDNMTDMAQKGRSKPAPSSGEKNGHAKLTEADAAKAIEMMVAGKTNTQIAAALGVTHGAISLIRRGKSWIHLSRPKEFPKYGSIRRPAPLTGGGR